MQLLKHNCNHKDTFYPIQQQGKQRQIQGGIATFLLFAAIGAGSALVLAGAKIEH